MSTSLPSPSDVPPAEPAAPVGRDWIAAGVVTMILGWVAGIRWSAATARYSWFIIILGGGLIVCGLAQLRGWLATRTAPYHRSLWLLPRIILSGIAVALIVGTFAAPRSQPCPPKAGIPDAGELIHSRFAGDHTVCTYEYTGTGSSL